MPPSLRCPNCSRWSPRVAWRNVELFTIKCPACGSVCDVGDPAFKLEAPAVDPDR